MLFVIHVDIPPEKFNAAVLDGTVGEKMGRILEEMRPQGAYFTAKDGNRGGYFIVDLEDNTEMPRIAEPWFLLFNARVEFLPAMTPEDLQSSGLDEMAKKWG